MDKDYFHFLHSIMCIVSDSVAEYSRKAKKLQTGMKKWTAAQGAILDYINGVSDLPDDYMDQLADVSADLRSWIAYNKVHLDDLTAAMGQLDTTIKVINEGKY